MNPEVTPQKPEPETHVPDAVIDPILGMIPAEYAALDGDPGTSDLPTIQEIGQVLPIGYRDQTRKLHRDFELTPWDWDVEESLGKLAEENLDMTMGVYISEILCAGVARIGELDFTKLKRSHRRLVVSNLFHADALYLYVHVRIGALGPQLRFDSTKCEKCRKPIDFVGDLRTLEVKLASIGEIPRATVTLDRPFMYGKAEVSRVVVGPLRWAFMETGDVATLTNPAKFRLATLQHGVVGLEGAEPGAPVVLSREHAREIGPVGVNRIVHEIDQQGGGAVMECAGRCLVCGTEFRRAIDWTYSNFFGRSSR